ncbi:hypothetical protein K438DRAFT_1959075 [Mycena galopus ATCC 62051]|nr:hypothetical protein K438DRAFT_1959075 [Mycena galopus ATCC 62051]
MSRMVGTIASPSSVACGEGGAEGRTSSFVLEHAHVCISWTGRVGSASRGMNGGARDAPGWIVGGRVAGGRATGMRWYSALGLGSPEKTDSRWRCARAGECASSSASPTPSRPRSRAPCTFAEAPSRKRADGCAEADVVEPALRDGDLDGGLRPRGDDAERGGSSGVIGKGRWTEELNRGGRASEWTDFAYTLEASTGVLQRRRYPPPSRRGRRGCDSV